MKGWQYCVRLYGKPVHEEALEFGERLWRQPPRMAGYNVLAVPG